MSSQTLLAYISTHAHIVKWESECAELLFQNIFINNIKDLKLSHKHARVFVIESERDTRTAWLLGFERFAQSWTYVMTQSDCRTEWIVSMLHLEP